MMKTMRMLVATLGMFTFGAIGCGGSSSSDKETLPKAATYEPENYEDDTTTVQGESEPTSPMMEEDRTPVSGSEDTMMDEETTDAPAVTDDETMSPAEEGTPTDQKPGDEVMEPTEDTTGTDVGSGGTPPDSNGM